MKKLLGILLIAILSTHGLLRAHAEDQPVRNVILFVADGCGHRQVEAASLYRYGRPGGQPYAAFPVSVAMSTFMLGGSYDAARAWTDFNYVNGGATDSAAAATALSTGQKTYGGAIGVDNDRKPLKHVLHEAHGLGKSVGVVTSVQLSHATPAGFTAHDSSRGNYALIAKQMICESGAHVIMGCGHPLFDDNGKPAKPGFDMVGGEETWNNIVKGTAGADSPEGPWKLVQTREEFLALAKAKTPPARVLGVPQVHSTLQQRRAGDSKADAFAVEFTKGLPTLEEMALAALNVLGANKKGLFLMIEGGAIDWAGHSQQSGRMIEEQIAFDDAVAAAIKWVEQNSNWKETLLIVTGDHETGYLTRPVAGADDKPWAYQPLANKGKGRMPGVQWHSGGHTNSLLPLYAKGAFAEAFKTLAKNKDPHFGPYVDNTDVARVIFAALRGKADAPDAGK